MIVACREPIAGLSTGREEGGSSLWTTGNSKDLLNCYSKKQGKKSQIWCSIEG